jgi:hypothetical protein
LNAVSSPVRRAAEQQASRNRESGSPARDMNAALLGLLDLPEADSGEARQVLIGQNGGAGARAGTVTVNLARSDAEEAAKEAPHALLTLENGVRASAIIVSAGMVSWTLHGAGLVASLLTSAPAWRQLDPMPVLAPEEEKPDWGDGDRDSEREEDAASMLWRADSPRKGRRW